MRSCAFAKWSEEGAAKAYFAWFEPEHEILHRAVPFFTKRFTNMDWIDRHARRRGCVGEIRCASSMHRHSQNDPNRMRSSRCGALITAVSAMFHASASAAINARCRSRYFGATFPKYRRFRAWFATAPSSSTSGTARQTRLRFSMARAVQECSPKFQLLVKAAALSAL